MKWALVLLLTASQPLSFLSSQPSTVQARLRDVDPVERELRLEGQRLPFVATFSSRLKVDGLTVTPSRFWRMAERGDLATIKSRSYGPFRVVDAVNIRTGEE